MKKNLLLILIVLSTHIPCFASKANPTPFTVTLANGQTTTAILKGDETFHWIVDINGHVLEPEGNVYRIVSSSEADYLATHALPQMSIPSTGTRATSTSPLFPHTGTPKCLVILAAYSDTTFSLKDPKASFNEILNKEGTLSDLGAKENRNYRSVKQYFIDQSNGTFAPQFDIVGPVMLPNSMEYYGRNTTTTTDVNYRQLLIDACSAASKDRLVNFADYDSDNDGYVDLVYVIYAGYGEAAGGEANTIWPKSFFNTNTQKFDNKLIGRAGLSNELLGNQTYTQKAGMAVSSIGLFCHEFSHCLGLPDFYPTVSAAQKDNQGMEDWSLMDNGEWIYNGWCPPNYTAWEREFMGWSNISTLENAGTYTLAGWNTGRNSYKIVHPTNPNEYFVLQCMDQTGWDRFIGYRDGVFNTPGLLVYHVNYSAAAFSLNTNSVNNVLGSPRMAVVPADGLLYTSYHNNSQEFYSSLRGDLFRNNAYFSQSGKNPSDMTQTQSLPNAKWFTAADDKYISNIAYTEGDGVTFIYMQPTTNGISLPTHHDENNNIVYSLDGRRLGKVGEIVLPRGIYIINHKKVVIH